MKSSKSINVTVISHSGINALVLNVKLPKDYTGARDRHLNRAIADIGQHTVRIA